MLFYYEPVKFRLVCCAGNTLRLTLLLFCICFLECGGGGGTHFGRGQKLSNKVQFLAKDIPKNFITLRNILTDI